MSSFLRFFSRATKLGFGGALFAELSDRALIFRTEVLLQARRPLASAQQPPDGDHRNDDQHRYDNPHHLGHFVDLLVDRGDAPASIRRKRQFVIRVA